MLDYGNRKFNFLKNSKKNFPKKFFKKRFQKKFPKKIFQKKIFPKKIPKKFQKKIFRLEKNFSKKKPAPKNSKCTKFIVTCRLRPLSDSSV